MSDNEIADAAVWNGPPVPLVVKVIEALTRVDSRGRWYYRRGFSEPWQRLREPGDFAELNSTIQKYRDRTL